MLTILINAKKESFVCLVLFLILSLFFYFGYQNSWLRGAGDNATYTEITYSIAHSGKAFSNTLFSALEFQQSPFFTQDAKTISQADFSAKDFSSRSSMKFHLTPLQYVLAPLVWIFTSENIWSFFTALSFSSMIFLCYLFLRFLGVNSLGAALFTAFLSVHPAWSHSLFGQFYIDRFFLVIGFIFSIIVFQKKSPKTVFIWAILCTLIIEKMIIIAGVYLLGFTALYWNQLEGKQKKYYILIAFSLFFYSTIIIKSFLDNYHYGSFLSLYQVLNFYKEVLHPSKNLIIFSFFNIIPLIVFSIFEWKLAFLALIIMGPNMAGSIGGAEKSCWITHYHTTYLPALFLALVLGFSTLYKKFQKPLHRYALYILTCSYALTILFINPYTLEFSSSEYLQNGIVRAISLTRDLFNSSGYHSILKKKELALQSIIPEGSVVSIPENLCVSLVNTRKIYIYPQGIKDADFVVAFYENKNGNHYYKGQFYTQSPDEIVRINDVLNKKLADFGFNIQEPIIINDIAILKKTQSKY